MKIKERNALRKSFNKQGLNIQTEHVVRFNKFLKLYYEDLQNKGVYLTDVPLHFLTLECRVNIHETAYYLWKKYKAAGGKEL